MTGSSAPPEEVIIFTRYPRAGEVKSRLVPELGEEGAAHIQQWMAERTAATVRTLSARRPVRCTICYTGASRQEMTDWLGDHFLLLEQQDGSLGKRMARAFRSSAGRGTARALLIGTDCPSIDQRLLENALNRLADHDLVLGPSADGGYYLIGLQLPRPATQLDMLFTDIRWGRADVLARTVAEAGKAGLSLSLLKELRDIDRPEDLFYLHCHPDPR